MTVCTSCTTTTSTSQKIHVENHDTSAYMTATRVEDTTQLLEEEKVRKNISDDHTLVHFHVQVEGASEIPFPFHRGNFSLYIPQTGEMLDESPLAEELFQSKHILHSTMISAEDIMQGELFFEVDHTLSLHDLQLRYESVDKQQKSKIYQLW